MNLFEFKLRPLTEVEPWGEEPDLSLQWYGLTDGFYHMNVGEEQLFRYSNELMDVWSKDHSYSNPFFEYQVVRLLEDVLDMLPDVLQPIPPELHRIISTTEKLLEWEDKLTDISDAAEDGIVEDIYYTASDWLFPRRLSVLGGGPDILLWRIEEAIHIRWDNTAISLDGHQAWEATNGVFMLPATEFITEVELFHSRLMNEMEERVQLIAASNPMPHVNIDIPELLRCQNERNTSLEDSLKTKPVVDNWDDVIAANKELLIL